MFPTPQGQPQPPQAPPPGAPPIAPQPPVTIDAVVAFLANDRMRGFRIDVETDTLIEADQNADKENRVAFVTAIGEFLAKVGPIGQQMPALAPMIGEMLKFTVRGFKVGQEMEDTIDKAMDAAGMALQNPPPPQPSPDELIKLEGIKAKVGAEIQKAQIDAQTAQADAQIKMRTAQMQAAQAQADHEHKTAEHGMKMQAMQAQFSLDQQQQAHEREMQAMQQQAAKQDFVRQQAEKATGDKS